MNHSLPPLTVLLAWLTLGFFWLLLPVRADNLPRIWQPVGGPDIVGALVRQTDSAALIQTPAGKSVALPLQQLGDEDTALPPKHAPDCQSVSAMDVP